MKPQVVTIKLRKKCTSHTWRFTSIKPYFSGLDCISVFEIKLLSSIAPQITGRRRAGSRRNRSVQLPAVGPLQMTVGPAAVTTHFGAPDAMWDCSGATSHNVLGTSRCVNVDDNDVNSAVVFKHNVQSSADPPSVEYRVATAVNFSSIWVYHHPANDGAGSHRRLKSFDVLCSMPGGGWFNVLDQANPHGQKGFSNPAPTRREIPCHTCWKEFKFEKACKSLRWKITNFNSKSPTEVFVFELKFSAAIARPALAPPKGARIQGWCILNDVARIGNGQTFSKPIRTPKDHDIAQTSIPYALRAVPTKSRFVVSLRSVNLMVKEVKKLPISAANQFPLLYTIKAGPGDKPLLKSPMSSVDSRIPLRTIDEELQGYILTNNWGHGCINQGYPGERFYPRSSQRLPGKRGWDPDVFQAVTWKGCAPVDSREAKKYHFTQVVGSKTMCTPLHRKTCCSTNHARINAGYHCADVFTNFAYFDFEAARNAKHLSVVARPTGDSKVDWKLQGEYKITYWWKPPLKDAPCMTQPGKLRYETVP